MKFQNLLVKNRIPKKELKKIVGNTEARLCWEDLNNIYRLGAPGREREVGMEAVFQEIVTKRVPKLMKPLAHKFKPSWFQPDERQKHAQTVKDKNMWTGTTDLMGSVEGHQEGTPCLPSTCHPMGLARPS
jgi:hypothetical protein